MNRSKRHIRDQPPVRGVHRIENACYTRYYGFQSLAKPELSILFVYAEIIVFCVL